MSSHSSRFYFDTSAEQPARLRHRRAHVMTAVLDNRVVFLRLIVFLTLLPCVLFFLFFVTVYERTVSRLLQVVLKVQACNVVISLSLFFFFIPCSVYRNLLIPARCAVKRDQIPSRV